MVVGSHQGVPGSSPGARTTNPIDALFRLESKRSRTRKKDIIGGYVLLFPTHFDIMIMWAGS